jgi:hypothetical protein
MFTSQVAYCLLQINKIVSFFTVSSKVGDDLHHPLVNVAEHDVGVGQPHSQFIELSREPGVVPLDECWKPRAPASSRPETCELEEERRYRITMARVLVQLAGSFSGLYSLA